ncbi:MAG: FadR family transcriptional regulator, partial [Deltaproteobacteria bacterium]|nr:FadR family transcriptional regulator [Deltaproteobacteria bacterium]
GVSGTTGVEADAAFHFTIGRATRNHALQKLVSGLMELLSRSREDSLQTDVRRKASVDAHRRIIAAIQKRDKNKARGEMLRHIEQVEESVLPTRRAPNKESHGVTKVRRIS